MFKERKRIEDGRMDIKNSYNNTIYQIFKHLNIVTFKFENEIKKKRTKLASGHEYIFKKLKAERPERQYACRLMKSSPF